tara:strand:- start:325 stop:546 length:222 start_codon:yes stop_codon:yes gene_type:complete
LGVILAESLVILIRVAVYQLLASLVSAQLLNILLSAFVMGNYLIYLVLLKNRDDFSTIVPALIALVFHLVHGA